MACTAVKQMELVLKKQRVEIWERYHVLVQEDDDPLLEDQAYIGERDMMRQMNTSSWEEYIMEKGRRRRHWVDQK